MTEAEWLAHKDPHPMMQQLGRKVSERGVRLLICACCRRAWDLLPDERSRHAVDVAERYAVGMAKASEFLAAQRLAQAAYQRSRKQHGPEAFRLFGAAHLAALATANRPRFDPRTDEFLRGAKERKDKTERKARSVLVREIFGNPFRPVALDSIWRTSTVSALAQAIYKDRAFDRLPILADALEDAGCTDQDILGHCRQPGEHCRGCWVVDLLLGKG
jgi:hypothetical protein